MRRALLVAGFLVVCLFSIISSPGLAQKGKQPPACSDVPVMASFYNGLTIQSDAGWYENGVSGVSAVLNTCNGTNDVTITTGSNRAFVYTFPVAVPYSSPSNQYGSLGGHTIQASSSLFVRNILYNPIPSRDSRYSFTSDAWFTFGDYRLRFVGPNDADLLWLRNQFPDDNENFVSSNVTVTFYPADDPERPSEFGSWIISGMNPNPDEYMQLGTLHGYFNGKIKWVHLGQYEMPFQLEVKALKVF